MDGGHAVTVLDDLSRGHEEAVPPGARFVRCDLLDRESLEREVSGGGYDGVLHFAACSLVGESVSSPEVYYRVNVAGTLNLLEAMIRSGTSRFVFSGSCSPRPRQPTASPLPN